MLHIHISYSSYRTKRVVDMKDIDTKRPRRLDLNAPLISTRRSNISSITSIEYSRTNSLGGSCDRVPFSWEQSPGKPKDAIRENGVEGSKVFLPLPKPPLIRWKEDDDQPTSLTSQNSFEGNENNDVDDDDGSFISDVIDLFSLTDSLNTSERLEFDGEKDVVTLSPNFMIQRFLPAATALAASSLSALADANDKENNNINNNNNPSSIEVYPRNNLHREGLSCVPRSVTGEAYSSKGCGFQVFFPWRAKHRLCGVKSPVRRVRASLKPQITARNSKY